MICLPNQLPLLKYGDHEVVHYESRWLRDSIRAAAEKAGWGGRPPSGVGRGVAFHFGYESYVAEVAEVEVRNGKPRVRRVVCAVDCGQVVNPDLVEAHLRLGRVLHYHGKDDDALRFDESVPVEEILLPAPWDSKMR